MYYIRQYVVIYTCAEKLHKYFSYILILGRGREYESQNPFSLLSTWTCSLQRFLIFTKVLTYVRTRSFPTITLPIKLLDKKITFVYFTRTKLPNRVVLHCTEVRFAIFLSSGFITAIVVNPPERKLAKRTSVQCWGSTYLFSCSMYVTNIYDNILLKVHVIQIEIAPSELI